MKKHCLAAFSLMVAAAMTAIGQEVAQRPSGGSEVLTRSVGSLSSFPVPTAYAFRDTMLATGLPGGEVNVEACTTTPKKLISVKGQTLREALDSITKADPRYRWELHEVVVNLVPADGLPSLLQYHLSVYDSGDAADPTSAAAYLFGLPELRDQAARLGLTQAICCSALGAIVPGPPATRKPLNVLLKNVTVQDALNALVRLKDGGLWSYHEQRCSAPNTFSFDFTEYP